MMELLRIEAPLTPETARALRAGQRVLLSGVVYTARDAAHRRLCELLDEGGGAYGPPRRRGRRPAVVDDRARERHRRLPALVQQLAEPPVRRGPRRRTSPCCPRRSA